MTDEGVKGEGKARSPSQSLLAMTEKDTLTLTLSRQGRGEEKKNQEIGKEKELRNSLLSSFPKYLIGNPQAFCPSSFSLPWREGVRGRGIFQQRGFSGKSIFKGNHPHPDPLPSREREKKRKEKKGVRKGVLFFLFSRNFSLPLLTNSERDAILCLPSVLRS